MSGAWHGGKGSSGRPISVSHEEYTNRWDHIFGRDKPKEVAPVDTNTTDVEQHITATKDISNLLDK